MNKRQIKKQARIVMFVDKIAEKLLLNSLEQDLVKSQFDEDEKEIAQYAISNLTTKGISDSMLVITFDSIFGKSELQEILKDYSKKATFIFDLKESIT